MPGPTQARANYLDSTMGSPTPTTDSTAPTADEQTRRLAMVLGIIAGDKYATPDTPIPESAPTHPANTQGSGTPDAVTHAAMLDQMGASKTVTPPDHGGTIYSGSFAHDLLASLNMPVTFSNIQAINAWMKAETGSQGAGTPQFNPLATTQKFGAYTTFNHVGVKNYADYHTGVMATANVLTNGKYGDILAALARGNNAVDVAKAVAASPWGTGTGVLRVLGAQH